METDKQYILRHPCGSVTKYRTTTVKTVSGPVVALQFWGCQGGWRGSLERYKDNFIEESLEEVSHDDYESKTLRKWEELGRTVVGPCSYTITVNGDKIAFWHKIKTVKTESRH